MSKLSDELLAMADDEGLDIGSARNGLARAAAEIERQERENADLRADRDAWCRQADMRCDEIIERVKQRDELKAELDKVHGIALDYARERDEMRKALEVTTQRLVELRICGNTEKNSAAINAGTAALESAKAGKEEGMKIIAHVAIVHPRQKDKYAWARWGDPCNGGYIETGWHDTAEEARAEMESMLTTAHEIEWKDDEE